MSEETRSQPASDFDTYNPHTTEEFHLIKGIKLPVVDHSDPRAFSIEFTINPYKVVVANVAVAGYPDAYVQIQLLQASDGIVRAHSFPFALGTPRTLRRIPKDIVGDITRHIVTEVQSINSDVWI